MPTERSHPAPDVEHGARDSPSGRRALARVALLVGGVAFVAFWTWALFFASKEAVNRIGDDAWRERAEEICATADLEREGLATFVEMRDATPEMVRERAGLIDRATDILDRMLDDVVAVPPADAKGVEVIPLWEAEYRSYLDARRAYTDELRATGENSAFFEPEVGGLPVSERLETFAGDNEMPSCSPPRDMT